MIFFRDSTFVFSNNESTNPFRYGNVQELFVSMFISQCRREFDRRRSLNRFEVVRCIISVFTPAELSIIFLLARACTSKQFWLLFKSPSVRCRLLSKLVTDESRSIRVPPCLCRKCGFFSAEGNANFSCSKFLSCHNKHITVSVVNNDLSAFLTRWLSSKAP